MRTRYFYVDGKWISEKEIVRQLSADAAAVIDDEIEPTQHPCDQQFYTSKRKFREITRLHGKEEIGNEYDAFMKEAKPQDSRRPVIDTLRAAWDVCETLKGKSEGEQREIRARFFGGEDFREETIREFNSNEFRTR